MDNQDLPRLARLVRVSLGLNVVVLLVNLGMFYGLLVFVLAEPADVHGVDPTAQRMLVEEADTTQEMDAFFKRTAGLLDRMARKHGANPTDYLPTDAEIQQAVESRTMHSDQSQAVLQKLKEGYEYFDLDWPIVMPQR